MNDSHWQKRDIKNKGRRLIVTLFFIISLATCGGDDNEEPSDNLGNTNHCEALNESRKSTTMSEIINITPRASQGDPLYKNQWHLDQSNSFVGGDINVTSVWAQGIRGQGVVVAVVDDGLEINHEDLVDNIALGKSLNYLSSEERAESDPTPLPGSGDYHGTAVAGIVAARDYNSVGGRGVAPRASLVGYNLLQQSTFLNSAHAMLNNKDIVAVSNNSWSFAADDTGELVASHASWRNAIKSGVKARNGKGISYVFAAGNGGERNVDNSNYDGYVNNRYVLAICSVGNFGKKATYSEKGANLWVCAPSLGDAGIGITTTDLSGNEGLNPSSDSRDSSDKNYTYRFGGTSASAPIVSGVIALILEKNPDLGWRDIRMILARSAVKNDQADSDWKISSGDYPYNINHKYGFGAVDAAAAVLMAEGWSILEDEEIFETVPSELNQLIPDDDKSPVIDTITVSENHIVEYVDVIVDIEHADIGDLTITLTSPMGTRSTLAETHDCQNECGVAVQCQSAFDQWSFGVARHLEERSQGEWQLSVVDNKTGIQGKIKSWKLKIYGRPTGE
ncbi:MAG: S8 family serine peptidase [Gammaproteobacteria bacterium]|nr:S8 family serine peptidase [Gammaproteobacteria bacterium]